MCVDVGLWDFESNEGLIQSGLPKTHSILRLRSSMQAPEFPRPFPQCKLRRRKPRSSTPAVPGTASPGLQHIVPLMGVSSST